MWHDLGWAPLAGLCHQVPKDHFPLRLLHVRRSGDDGLEELNLMSPLIFILVCVPPETDINFQVRGQRLRKDPPLMPVKDRISQGRRVICDGPDVTGWRGTCAAHLDGPERQVQV